MLQKPLPAEAAEAKVCQAQRMEIVGQLTGGVVHDFNNILTVITGTIEILAEGVADRPELAAIAKLIAEAAARGANLTSYLLAFANGQPSQPRNVDVNALLVEATRLLRPTLGEQIEICSVSATDVPPVWVDPSRLMTAILRLAIVARDAMPEGGRLAFETRGPGAGESSVSAGSAPATADDVVIAATASGYGICDDRKVVPFADLCMAEDFLANAFLADAFSESSSSHMRVGRGLSREASVEIHLPIAARLSRSPAQGSSKPAIEGGDEAILIVEDDTLVRRYVVAQAQSLGYRTLAAGNASEALAIIEAGEEIDLLLTDVMMPGSMSGRQLAIEALNRQPLLKVLYTSGYSKSAMLLDGFLDAGVLLLAKPYRKADLAKMIRTALAI
jgi:CheY-like chemotaxis protein